MRANAKYISSVVLLVALGLFVAGLQTATVQAKNPVTHPLKITGQATILDIFGPPPWAHIDQGVSSDSGRYVTVGKWDSLVHAIGIDYHANGDQVFWEATAIAPGKIRVIFKGGTGRYANCSGEFIGTGVADSDSVVPGPKDTWSAVYSYTGEGTITY